MQYVMVVDMFIIISANIKYQTEIKVHE